MQTETAADLLEAVGYDYSNFLDYPGYAYTGPALGTPELDALLLVAGQRWLAQFAEVNNKCWDVLFRVRKNGPRQYDLTNDIAAVYLIAICPLPGHALARAIREVGK